MAITEFVIPALKQEAETIEAFSTTTAPFLIGLIDKIEAETQTGPLLRVVGKLVLENGKDVSGEFRPFLGLEWRTAEHFTTLITSEQFSDFIELVKPHSVAKPNPQLYETDVGPADAFGSAFTEVWQVKVGDENGREEEAKMAWKKFLAVVGSEVKSLQGTSLNQEEKLWVGILGWVSMEAREKALCSSAVIEAKKALDGLVWNTFLATFAK
ncbi:hypothetical protein VTL71DRAFT_2063 [Oculimacula yallundae]|uniref:Uncharacterized protein n=1 Tax=Oculimacula yallundae TaxID=86028 RepID=A0ABR4C7T7_9HELO